MQENIGKFWLAEFSIRTNFQEFWHCVHEISADGHNNGNGIIDS